MFQMWTNNNGDHQTPTGMEVNVVIVTTNY